MKEIPLSQQGKKKGLFVAIVDDDDYERVAAFRWHVLEDVDVCGLKYATHSARSGNTNAILMHRFILGTESRIDHIDGNGLNNTKINLRAATNQENSFNRTLNKNSTTGIKGVSFERGKFNARIKKDGKKIFIGSFSTREEAGRAYDAKAIELFGEFAKLNFQ